MSQAFICAALRTPFGRYAGALSALRADDLAALPIAALRDRHAGIDWNAVDDVILGCANQAGEDNRNVARMALLLAGLPDVVPGATVNRLCGSGLEAVGLDPQLGFLHAVRPGRAALALDLQEEFRSVLADRFALTLINRGQLTARDFDEREGGAVMLNEAGRRALVTAWQERKQEEITHPTLETKVPLAALPFIQARILARTLRGDLEGYLPYLAK